MSTEAERDPSCLDPLRLTLQEPCHSWTDDLPVCDLSGVGCSTNQIYRKDGIPKPEHEFEDRSFHFRLDDVTFFYGVFDGHSGTRAVEFAAQRMPAEILLGQLKGKETDKDVKEVLHQAFLTVEKSFFQSIDNLLAEKENLRLHLQSVTTYEALQQYPAVIQRLNCVTAEINSGTTAVVALLYKNKLYVANTGDSRALLYKEDKLGNPTVYQLSLSHTFSNDDELLRLSQLGVDTEKLCKDDVQDHHRLSRCIGNYTVKGGYKELDYFREAIEEPVIAVPDISGGIEIDDSCKFLVLMSGGLYKSVEQSTGKKDVNNMIIQMVKREFSEQTTLSGVAQAVIDKIVRTHHDIFMKKEGKTSELCQKRDDITLMVRNFNYSLQSTDSTFNPEVSSPNEAVQTKEPVPADKIYSSEKKIILNMPSSSTLSAENTEESNSLVADNDDSKDISVSSSSDSIGLHLFHPTSNYVSLDEEGKIKPYVDFSDFYAAVEEAFQKGLAPADWRDPAL